MQSNLKNEANNNNNNNNNNKLTLHTLMKFLKIL